MPFTLLRKRPAISAPSRDRCSSSTAISNDDGAAHIKTKTSCKRKKQCTQSTVNSKAIREYGKDISNNRRQLDTYTHEGDSEPLCISSILLQLYEKRLVLNLGSHVGIDNKYQHLLQLLKEQQEECGGCGQDLDGEVDLAASRALEEYYAGLGDCGLATLKKDIATCFQVSDSDTDEDESLAADEGDINNTTQDDEEDVRFDGGSDERGLDELGTGISGIPTDGTPLKFDRAPNGVESGKQSADVVASGGDGDIAQDTGDISYDIGSNESINGGLGESSTSTPADVPLHDNAQSSTTTTTLKLDISCIGHGVEETRKDDGPSPTNATANLSSFTRDASPAFDSSNGSYDDGNEDALPSFNNDGVVSPKKVDSTKDTRPQPKTSSNLVSTSAPVAQYPPQQYQYYPPPNQYGYSYPPPNQYGYSYPPPNQYGYQQPRYPPNQYSYPPPNQYNYPPLPNHYSYPHPPQHSVSNYPLQGVPQYYSYPSPHQGSSFTGVQYPIQHHHASHQTASSRTYPTVPASLKNVELDDGRGNINNNIIQITATKPLNIAQIKLLEEEKKKQMTAWLLECMQYTPEVDSAARSGSWDNDETKRLLLGIYLFGFSNWKSIQKVVLTREYAQVSLKGSRLLSMNAIKAAYGALSTKEDVQEFYKQTLPKVMNQLAKKNQTNTLPTRHEVTKEIWHKRHAHGIKQAQQLVPNKSEAITFDLELDSVHHITSNLDPNKINIEYAKSIFQHYMIRELEGRLESGTTVSVTSIIRQTDKKRVWAKVVYQVVKIEDSKLQAPVVSSSTTLDGSADEIIIKGYTFPPSVNARYHVSLGDLLKMYGTASLQHLYNLDEVASLDTAKRVDLMGTKNPIRKHGGVYTFDYDGKESTSSLPLSPIWEEEEEEEEEEFIVVGKKKKEKDKHGMTGSFGGRQDKYLFKGKDGKMYIRIDGEDLSIEADAGLCKLYDLLMDDVKNDLRVPPWIKRALCIMLHKLGGDRFGAKKKIVYLLLEMALQLEDGHSVPGEMFQWDDTVFIGMVTKLMEALEAIKPILDRLPKNRVENIIMKLLSSWPPGTDEERLDQVYNTLVAEAYIGLSEGREDAFDGPAKPDWKTQAEKYSKEYTVKQFDAAIHKIKVFIKEANKLRKKGCVFLLDKNDLACGKGENLEDILKSFDFEVEVTLYESPNDIVFYTNGKAIIVVHGPLSVGGTIMFQHFSLDDMLQRCLVIDTLRGIVCMAKGEEFNGPYLAIEAGMMQKLLVKGLHITREYGVPAAFFREYLNTSKHVKCFDLYGGGRWVHYPEYPISQVNRGRYRNYNM